MRHISFIQSVMEFTPWRVTLFLGMVFIAATVMSTALLMLLGYLKIIRQKRTADNFVWGIVGGLLITFMFVMLKCNNPFL